MAELDFKLNFKNTSFRDSSPVYQKKAVLGIAMPMIAADVSLSGGPGACYTGKKIKICAYKVPFPGNISYILRSQSMENSGGFLLGFLIE